MSGSANVHSVESIESVQSALVAFGEQVAQAQTVLSQEIRRLLDWLEHDRPKYWKARIYRATDELAGLVRYALAPSPRRERVRFIRAYPVQGSPGGGSDCREARHRQYG